MESKAVSTYFKYIALLGPQTSSGLSRLFVKPVVVRSISTPAGMWINDIWPMIFSDGHMSPSADSRGKVVSNLRNAGLRRTGLHVSNIRITG